MVVHARWTKMMSKREKYSNCLLVDTVEISLARDKLSEKYYLKYAGCHVTLPSVYKYG